MSDEPVEDPPPGPEQPEPEEDEDDAPLYHPEAAAVAQVVVERTLRNTQVTVTREQATYTMHKLADLITEAYKDSCYKVDHRAAKALRVSVERSGESCTDAACPGRHAP